jgi:hypothetical protein
MSRETVITCDRCGKEFRYPATGPRSPGWEHVWPVGVRSGTRDVADLADDELRGIHVCLACLSPEEAEEIAAEQGAELARELAWAERHPQDEPPWGEP